MTEEKQSIEINLRKELETFHNRPVYKNYKTGKYYTFEADEATGETQLFTVFVNDATFDNQTTLVDKNGRAYKVLSCKMKTTKNGYIVFTA